MNRNVKPIVMSSLAALWIGGAAASETAAQEPLASEQSDDGIVTANVKAALAAETMLSVAEISIETVQGNVRLSGYVGKPGDIQKAAELARGIAGVRAVRNELKTR